MLNNPVSFKNVKNIVPFAGDTFVFSKSYDANLGNDLGLYNLLTLDVKIKSNISKTNGIKLRISGRTINTESTTAIVADGLLDGTDKFNESTILRDTGKYRIQYDISAIREGWIWIIPFTPSADVKVNDVCDIRVSIQNSNNLLPNPKAHPRFAYSYSNVVGGNAGTSIDVRNIKALNLKINTFGEGSGYYEFYINGKNPVQELKGLMLYNADGSELKEKRYSDFLKGYLWQIPAKETLDLILDVSNFDSIAFTWLAKGDAATSIPYNLLFIKEDNAFENISNISYYGKSFNLEKVKRISDCLWNTFVITQDGYISISTNGIDGNYKHIDFTSANFPSLKDGSTIHYAWVLPRHAGHNQTGIYARVVIVTSKGQIYHNYPERPNGTNGGDEYRFDESVIWDLPVGKTTRRHPSKDANEKRVGYRYDPTLSNYAYTMNPAINKDNGFGNGGFSDSIGVGDMTRPRFYEFDEPHQPNDSDKDTNVDNPFRILSYPCKTRKSTFLGTYQINRARVCLFSTPDGGRNWFVEYEFASGGRGNSVGMGNSINTSMLASYTANSFNVVKREYIDPSNEDKEPIDLFKYGTPISITSISSANEAIVTTATAHGLADFDVIVLTKNNTTTTAFDFMANTASVKDGGTGVLYQVKKIDNTKFYLREYIYSPDNNLTTRHIHYVNELKDFIAFGTGETYPNGWIMLLNQRLKDAFAKVDPSVQYNEAFRLNSSPTAPQRLCSFWMLDDDPKNPSVFLGSDEVGIKRPNMEIEGRTNLPARSSAGIFKGKLSDMDDMSKFVSVLDIGDVNIYCFNFNGILIAGFQMGHNALSFDNGMTWEIINMGSMLRPAGIDSSNTIYFTNGNRLKIK